MCANLILRRIKIFSLNCKKCLTRLFFYDIITNCQADMAQAVERILGKDEVPSSNLGISSSGGQPY